jgi:F0F1-type ATP synthase assembly protein I
MVYLYGSGDGTGPAMPREDRKPLAPAIKSTQDTDDTEDTVTRAGPAAAASYTLIGAILVLGGLGYAIDAWRGTSHAFLIAGLVLGMIVGFYELARSVWKR